MSEEQFYLVETYCAVTACSSAAKTSFKCKNTSFMAFFVTLGAALPVVYMTQFLREVHNRVAADIPGTFCTRCTQVVAVSVSITREVIVYLMVMLYAETKEKVVVLICVF